MCPFLLEIGRSRVKMICRTRLPLRMTVVGRVVLYIIPNEGSHPERRVEVYPPPVVEWV